jgi:transcriptional regulator with XRE-family HTH domain
VNDAGFYGRQLRTLRRAANTSQTDLAEAMSARGHRWTQSTVAKIEGGGRGLGVAEYFDALEVLGGWKVAQ